MSDKSATTVQPGQSRAQAYAVSIMGVVIIGFCAYGFGSKFIELVRLVVGDSTVASEGVFAVAPLANYVLASAGFLCLMGWAAANGMFYNIEGPKRTMLQSEETLDADANDGHYADSVLLPRKAKS